MAVNFSLPLADSRDYPHPQIFVEPDSQQRVAVTPHRLSVERDIVLPINQARSGLYLIARVLSRTGDVWMPSYHCPALVEPFLAAGMAVRFYPITAKLQPDFDYLHEHYQHGDRVLGVRYFGFETGLNLLAAFCREKKCLLIEDLAHAAFSDRLVGDVGVTSLAKFYPVNTGAELLISADSPICDSLRKEYKRLPDVWLEKTFTLARKLRENISRPPRIDEFRYFKLGRVSRHIDSSSARILRDSNQLDIVTKRKSNYRYLMQKLESLSTGQMLFPSLDKDTVPYAMPFVLNNAALFDHIRQQGVQINRWEELADTQCAVSKDYRARLIQLPVHQGLTEENMDFMSIVLSGKYP